MRLVLLLLFSAAVPAEAFLFGRTSDAKAEAGLAAMREAFGRSDCVSVLASSEAFLREKPPAALREEAYGYIGRCYEAAGSADKAITLYKLAIELYPGNGLFASRLARIYNRAGFPENAVPLFLQVLRLTPDDLDANIGLARAYAALGFLSRAKDFYSRAAILQDFKDGAVLEEYARCMLRKRDWEEALLATSKGRLLSPRSALWPLLEARVQAGRGEYYAAVALMDSAVRFNSDRHLRLERALYLLMGGLPQRAIEAADAELASDQGDPLACAVKGMALHALGRKGEAERYFVKARAGGGPFISKVAGAFLPAPAGLEAAYKR